jgi:hypothetical protein
MNFRKGSVSSSALTSQGKKSTASGEYWTSALLPTEVKQAKKTRPLLCALALKGSPDDLFKTAR